MNEFTSPDVIAGSGRLIRHITAQPDAEPYRDTMIVAVVLAQFLSAVIPEEYERLKNEMLNFTAAMADKLHAMRQIMAQEES